MKSILFLFSVFFLLTSSAQARVVLVEDKLYLREEGKQIPIFLVNEMIKKKEISKVKLYGGGKINVISFSKGDEKERVYSIDKKGYIYAIEPFANYEIAEVDVESGHLRFKEEPKRKYRVTAKGFFLY